MTALNIKNENTVTLAKRLAAATGESLTEAVTTAISERLARVEGPDFEERLRRLEAISKRSAPLWKDPWKSVPHGDLLYDEATGLPK